ncbi:SLAC1 anion channel family protein [Acuticoccus mangrovi]|uniref:SLAC1 anion channel family protein n=1 Tax=Acuticoccus mangrovi TaxID=2796142 RepID=UPI002FC6B950
MTTPAALETSSRIEHFPIGYFGMSMGLFGFALALRAAGFPVASHVGMWVGLAAFVVLAAMLILKATLYTSALVAEWHHPVRIAFFPATTISLLLFAALIHHDAPGIATVVWIVGAVGQGVLTVVVVSAWISHRAFGPGHLSPAWFIPAVGNVVVPLAGAPLGYEEACWYFFAVGIVFWLVLLTIIFNRLIFHDPIPERLRPTLVILIAPPAVAFVSWIQLHSGALDDTARVLINAGYFFTAVVLVQLPSLLRLPFSLPFWALSFPLAAITVASFRFADLTGSAVHKTFGYVLLIVLAIAIVGLLLRTIRAVWAGEICRPE